MKRTQRLRILAICISMMAGILFLALPEQWIEMQLGRQLDGGNGLVEFLLAAAPICAGAVLALGLWGQRPTRARPRHRLLEEQGSDASTV